MIKFFFAAFLLFFSPILSAQVISVLDESNRQPLPGVVISNLNNHTLVKTDEKGNASLIGCQLTDTLRFEALGYQIKKISLAAITRQNYQIFLKKYKANSLKEMIGKFVTITINDGWANIIYKK